MKIYFCDLCNESVPHSDLEHGRAFIRKSRVVCVSCDRAMSGADELSESTFASAGGGTATAALAAPAKTSLSAPPTPATSVAPAPVVVSAPGGAGLWAGLVALLFTTGAVYLVVERMKEFQGDIPAAREAAIAASTEWTDARITKLEAALLADGRESREALSGQLAASKDQTEQALAQLSDSIDERLAGLDGMRADIAALDERILDAAVVRDAGLEDLAARLGRIDEDVRFVLDRLNQLELRVQTGNFDGGGPSPLEAADAEPRAAAWSGILPDLQSPNSGTRWGAVQALGETGDVAVVPHLIPMLKDVDIFVRMATARVMGDLDATASIPHLIDALEDPEPAVQEAAVVSLRSITGREFGFDFQSNESTRAKKVKAWRNWWEKAQEDFKK